MRRRRTARIALGGSVAAAGLLFVTAPAGASWHRPAVRLQSTDLSSLSCTTPSACIAVGEYVDNTTTEQILAEQFS